MQLWGSSQAGGAVSTQQTTSRLHLLRVHCVPEQVISCGRESIDIKLYSERIRQRGEPHWWWVFFMRFFYLFHQDWCDVILSAEIDSQACQNAFGRAFNRSGTLFTAPLLIYFSIATSLCNAVPIFCDNGPIQAFLLSGRDCRKVVVIERFELLVAIIQIAFTKSTQRYKLALKKCTSVLTTFFFF